MSEDRNEHTGTDLASLEKAVREIAKANQQEVELKKAELDVRRAEIESNERLGMTSIQANKEHHQEHLRRFNDHLVHRYWFIGAVTLGVLVFATIAIFAGAKELVADLVKLLGGAGAGAFGGYYYGKSKNSNE